MITDIDRDIAYILLLIETKEPVHMESNKYYSYKTDANTHKQQTKESELFH